MVTALKTKFKYTIMATELTLASKMLKKYIYKLGNVNICKSLNAFHEDYIIFKLAITLTDLKNICISPLYI